MDYRLLGATFLEGILSFFSPCVLPLIPLYMSYLAGDNKETDEEGNIRYKTGKVFLTTLFFVFGISLTFVLLSLSLNLFSSFLDRYNEVISIIGGVLLILFGLHECGLIRIDILNKEAKLRFEPGLKKMNYFNAFLLGFVFSLGWSPCIGPMLANALLLASTSSMGYLCIVSYGLGLVIPFLLTGLFTNAVLGFISRNRKLMKYVNVIAGIVLILFGCYMIREGAVKIDSAKKLNEVYNGDEEDVQEMLMNYEFEDINGKPIRLSDYEGEYILLNFSATWCTYCDMELPDLAEFAKSGQAKCFVVMSPLNESNGIDDIKAFAEERDLEVELLIDKEGVLFYYCGVSAYPTTYIISPEGEFICYANGAMTLEGFEGLLDYAKQINEEE